MSSILEYKGYHAKVEYSVEDEVLFGTVLGINDLITFEADSAEDIKKNFHEAMDDYLSMCDRFNKEPILATLMLEFHLNCIRNLYSKQWKRICPLIRWLKKSFKRE